ncbi:histone acetylation 2 protein [Rutstroemia sp. NJR-2017a BVV2]|nr:histone acetylation 2 protein [Rutstroemia sp. NJR-2017a BVV2]
MAPSPLQQRRTHNTLLFQKLLNLRDGASPFTLVLDTLEQSGAPIVKEFWRRALISKSKIIFISFSTLQKRLPFAPDVFISAHNKTLSILRKEIISHLPSPTQPLLNQQSKSCQTTPNPTTLPSMLSFSFTYLTSPPETLLIIDTLAPLSQHPTHLSPFLSSLLLGPSISLLATHHLDLPTPTPSPTYHPSPLTTLLYLATAILHIHSFHHELALKRARDKSLREPLFGLAEGKEGVLMGLTTPSSDTHGSIIISLEIRRKSGRGVREMFVYTPPASSPSLSTSQPPSQKALGTITLLDEHPLFATPDISLGAPETEEEGVEGDVTFNLGLTEKQRRDRDGVVLPYFDAQKEGGIGSGGKILYEMGAEDREDFDDEEDEI